MAGLEPAAIGSIPPCSTIVWATRPYNTVFELVRLTHSCVRNADLTSSGHAVWPSLLHRPLIRSVTTSLILLQTSLIISSWWEFMWIFRPWRTTFYGGFRPNSIIKSTCTLVVPAWIEQATRGFSVPCSTDWATEPYLPCLFMPLLWFSQGVPPRYIGQGIVDIILKRVGFEPCISGEP